MNLVCLSRITAQHSVKGGMENHLAGLAEGLVERGHSVTVITTGRRDTQINEETINGVRYLYTDSPPEVYSSRWSKETAMMIRSLHAKEKIDLVWAEGGGAFGVVSVLQQLGIPYIPIAQGTIPGDLLSYARQVRTPFDVVKFLYVSLKKLYLLFRYELRYLRRAAKIIVVSDELKKDMHRYYGLPEAHIEVVYNGMPEDIFYSSAQLRSDMRIQLGIPQDAIMLLGMGRLIREKGFHLLVEAFASIYRDTPNVYLVIGGKGEFEHELCTMIEQFGVGDRVVMTGFVAHHDTVKYYVAADIFVSPTLRVEGLPLTFCEAMLCGLPVVSSSLGGNPSAVKDGQTGLLLDRITAEDVVIKVSALVANRNLLSQLSVGARTFALQHFTKTAMVEGTLKVFTETVENTSKYANKGLNIVRVVWDWPPPWTGLAPGPYELTVAQQRIGNTITVLTGGWPRRAKDIPPGVRLFRLPSGLIPGLNVSVFFTTAPFALVAYLVYRMFNRVDVLHVHGHLSLIFSVYKRLFGWLDKTPYVVHFHHVSSERATKIYTEHGGKVPLLTRLEWSLHQWSDRIAVAVADKLVFVSSSMQDGFLRYYVPDNTQDNFYNKAILLGNGVNVDTFTAEGEKAQLPWSDKRILLFVGNLVQRKNPDVLIHALSQLGSDYAGVFIGMGDQYDVLKKLVQELGVADRVFFAGYIPNDQLPPYFRMADVFVLPSKSEGFPKVVLEALACGVPVVASGFDPGPDFGGMVLIPKALTPESIADSVIDVLGSGRVVDVHMIQELYSWEAKAKQLQEELLPYKGVRLVSNNLGRKI